MTYYTVKVITRLTNVQQDCSIWLLIHNMILEDLVVQRSGLLFYGRHVEQNSL